MLNKAKILVFTLQLFIPLCAAVSRDEFDNQIARIQQLVAGADFHQAALTATRLRNQIISKQELRTDYVSTGNSVQETGISVSVALSNIQKAQESFHSGDRRAAVRALDLVTVLAAGLDRSQNPAARYAAAMQGVDAESTPNKDALPTTLHHAARAAYDAGRFSESIALAQRELKALSVLGVPTGRNSNVSHALIGLNYPSLGDDGKALAELEAAARVEPDSSFVMGPSMALAAQLLSRHPDAVLAYLDVCSRNQYWPRAARALAWKQQIENAKTPDFGELATGAVWR